jgi:hypothetical protein
MNEVILCEAAGGDQLVGRVACGLPLDSRMSILPPHFNVNGLKSIETLGWENVVQGYENYGPKFASVLPMLLASVVYHQDWLRDFLPSNHPLFLNRLFTSGRAESLKLNIILCENRCDGTGMSATGVLSYIATQYQVKAVEKSIVELKSGCKRDREIVVHAIEEFSEKVPRRTCEEVLNNFQVSGAIPMTRDQISTMFVNFSDEVLNKINSLVHVYQQQSSRSDDVNITATSNASDHVFMSWHWKGEFHMVPEGFRLPLCPPRQLWDPWWRGNINDKIQPYRFLSKRDLCCKTDIVNLTRIRGVFSHLVQICIHREFISSAKDLPKMSFSQLDRVFDESFSVLLRKLYTEEELLDERIGDFQYCTVYEGLRKLK